MQLNLTASEVQLLVDMLDELVQRSPDIVPLGDPDGTHQRGEMARALAARLRLAPVASTSHASTHIDRERAIREVFRLAVDVLLDVADERPLTGHEYDVLAALSPDLAARVRQYRPN